VAPIEAPEQAAGLFDAAGLFKAEDGMEENGLEREALDDEPGLAWEPSGEPLELGDIVISLESAARQAAAAGTSLEAELQFLASHGLLHLLGWDHPDEASLATMLSRQEALITGA
jgi:rRNA maturation RNase YbeY